MAVCLTLPCVESKRRPRRRPVLPVVPTGEHQTSTAGFPDAELMDPLLRALGEAVAVVAADNKRGSLGRLRRGVGRYEIKGHGDIFVVKHTIKWDLERMPKRFQSGNCSHRKRGGGCPTF